MRRQALVVLLFIAFLSTPISSTSWAQSTAPQTSLTVSGLRERATVGRDERGIPYIEAANLHDLYFAQGYVTASDRLWQMDLLRRSGRGELSELFGKIAFEEDKRHRTLGFARLSEAVAAKLSGETREYADSYAAGVNAYIKSRDERTLPVEFRILKYAPRPWTPADSLVISFVMHDSLSTTWQTDLMRAAMAGLPKDRLADLLMEYTPLDTPVVGSDKVTSRHQPKSNGKKISSVTRPSAEMLAMADADQALRRQSLDRVGLDAEALAASNNWVVSGKRTESGKPLLASDPHLSPSVPGIWYLVHLSAPGLRAAGVSIPGISNVIIGHNERIAWGMTNLAPDVQDLYRERFEGSKYLTPAGWKEAEIRREEIKVRKQPASPETEITTVEVKVTRHGPVILEKDGEAYALRWTLWDTKPETMLVFHKLNRAKNWTEFTGAIRDFGGATQNIVYADVDGHIGYYGAGMIPIRKSGDGSVPVDGSKDDGEWTSWIPFDKLPHVLDPPSGVIVTANARVVGRDYPYFLTHAWSAPYRQKRINDLLASKTKITIEDFRATQGDVYAIGGSIFASAVVKLMGEDVADAKFKESLKLMSSWDGRAAPDSKAALLVHEMRDVFSSRILWAALGDPLSKQYRWTNRHYLMDRIVTDWPANWLPKYHPDWKDFVASCYSTARENLAKRLGDDESKWTFGSAVQVRLNHPLAAAPLVGNQFKIEPFPQNGNGYSGGLGPTVNVGPTVSMRLIADPSNWDNTRHGILLGQSGDPQSKHYKDQLADWRSVSPRVFPFTEEAVKKAAVQTTTLTP